MLLFDPERLHYRRRLIRLVLALHLDLLLHLRHRLL
jgi:hypothetical protein